MPTTSWPIFWHDLLHLGAPNTVTWLEKVVRPIVVYLVLVFALRWFGKRTLAQLNPFDFVVLLTLSNTVQNAIIGNDTSLAGELTAKAHERGFDSLDEIADAVLYPNGTIYFRGRHPDREDRRHRELLERLDHLQHQLAMLQR
ncbi:MAG TPA: hypothetical protein VFS33_02410 [Gemmatimonadales bacterium]|nr:hypothetical protein [Gemmatimonadales bacterium]